MHWIEQPLYDPPKDEAETRQHALVVHHRSENDPNHRLVIFVHGLGGSRYGEHATWGLFPAMLFEDRPDTDVGLYRYDTATARSWFKKSISLEDEARVFADTIRHNLERYDQIVLVGHSMGGLLCKAAICELLQTREDNALDRICGLILMATPQLGSLLMPRFLARFSQDARALAPHSEFVDRVNTVFEDQIALDEKTVTYRKQTIPTWAVEGVDDFWVDRLSSGIGLPSSRRRTVRASHTSIVKPHNRDSDSYAWVRKKVATAYERFKYDVFLAAAMEAHPNDDSYAESRMEVLSLKKTLEAECGFRSVFYAGETFKDQNTWDQRDLALQTDLAALRGSRYFLLYYPERTATSALYEAGWALILGKPSVYITRSLSNLPFLLRDAHQAFSPQLVKIYDCPDVAAACKRLAAGKRRLFLFEPLHAN